MDLREGSSALEIVEAAKRLPPQPTLESFMQAQKDRAGRRCTVAS